ncbi:TetR/AcrR family transcriptional regulator [Ochrobactrum soli]|uniref:TetR/AcrR family transcriptional regulator n=1 Tax=Ochrobactrum soli TaxID=2448455 RepID=A0A2P9HDG5_9HYPH|nr:MULTISPECIES: TetR/AcrR family transcriptional regulator [Brucella]RRD22213.1 TetR/AcrR family transcriptional regulator [Brucellaceae bacterium VT-16-1752]MDX4073312.1 helix-turn-helix domain-containing protein [Brucella sp. NBRC 113783]NNU60925.1 TetR/AcrR family transcriptional regulator [[Ochrobactrum] soli]RLL71193.1 TetR/AcrR family transcriptional regulator [[Ochrobactrum] soli]SPL62144.1 Transcriptional regulator, TetR family [[Ochrobactrum] soli]
MTKNELRTSQTKGRLVAAARTLFAREGYAQTSTEAIIAAAGVTRGALYHHYRDKSDLFEVVCRDLAVDAAEEIRIATEGLTNPVEALEQGSLAWIDFMLRPESRRILVIDAPGVLGRERWEALDRELSFDLLRIGVEEAIDAGAIRFSAGPTMLAILLNGAMNEIALRAEEDDVAALKAGLLELLGALKS